MLITTRLRLSLPAPAALAHWSVAMLVVLGFAVSLAYCQSSVPIPVPSGLEGSLPESKPATSAAASNQPKHLTKADQVNLILNRALLNAVWGPSVHCKIHQEIKLGNQTIRGTGIYARGGVGEMKLVLQAVAGNSQNRLEQVSDGRRLRSVLRINGDEEGYHVDLTKVYKSMGNFTPEDYADPKIALHLAIGGQNEKLRALCQLYEWNSVKATAYIPPDGSEEVAVWELTGTRTLKGVLRGTTTMDALLVASDDAKMAPDQAKVIIGRGGALPFWLFAVEETRQAPSEWGGKKFSIRIDYHDPVATSMPPGTFSADDFASSAGSDVDETSKYIPPGPL